MGHVEVPPKHFSWVLWKYLNLIQKIPAARQLCQLITQQLCAPVFPVNTNKISVASVILTFYNLTSSVWKGQETQAVYAGLDKLAIYNTYILEFYVRNKELVLVLALALFLYIQVTKKTPNNHQHMCQLLCTRRALQHTRSTVWEQKLPLGILHANSLLVKLLMDKSNLDIQEAEVQPLVWKEMINRRT